MSAEAQRKALRKHASRKKAEVLQRFFKTGPGQYGEGDIFAGVVVPDIRKVAKSFKDAAEVELLELLKSEIHEERLLALLIIINQFEKASEVGKEALFKLYLKNTRYINNWDLVDISAPNVVGAWLFERNRDVLNRLAKSKSLWERRIAVVSTFYFIRKGDYHSTLEIAALSLEEKEDLIHKAVGWMLREVGKRSLADEEKFLGKHYKKMPRTMLRYAIERFPEVRRKAYLLGNI